MRFFAAKIFFFKKNLHILRKSSNFAAIMRSRVLTYHARTYNFPTPEGDVSHLMGWKKKDIFGVIEIV
jgi:hypothetical protein